MKTIVQYITEAFKITRKSCIPSDINITKAKDFIDNEYQYITIPRHEGRLSFVVHKMKDTITNELYAHNILNFKETIEYQNTIEAKIKYLTSHKFIDKDIFIRVHGFRAEINDEYFTYGNVQGTVKYVELGNYILFRVYNKNTTPVLDYVITVVEN